MFYFVNVNSESCIIGKLIIVVISCVYIKVLRLIVSWKKVNLFYEIYDFVENRINLISFKLMFFLLILLLFLNFDFV